MMKIVVMKSSNQSNVNTFYDVFYLIRNIFSAVLSFLKRERERTVNFFHYTFQRVISFRLERS
jgi:hypothetical protein